jgi:HYR domain
MGVHENEIVRVGAGRVGRASLRVRHRWVAVAVAAITLLAATAITAGTAVADPSPSNDDISGATAIASLPFNGTQDSLTATQNAADPTPSCGAPNNYTVWYSFTPSSDMTVQANTSGGDFFPPTATAYTGPADATTASPLTEVACSTSGLQMNLTAGTTYYFMLGSYTPRPTFTFTVQAVVPPANDDIANATPVGVLPFTATQDSLTATQDPHDPTPSCGAPNDFTVWYSYTPSTDGAIEATATPGPNVTVYAGAANATATSPLTQVDCSTSGPIQVSVTAGTTYYFMLGSYLPSPTFSFDVQALVPPANDEISGATAITSLPFNATQDSLTATQNAADPTPSCGAPNGYTVWYSFTPSSDMTVQANTTGGDFFPPIATAYSGPPGATPASPLTEAACSTSGLQMNLTAGTTYYFMLGSYASPRPSFTFTLQAVVPPANDSITNATPVGVLPFTATQDSLTATQDQHDPTPSCGTPNDFTVWYSYTPSTDGLIQVTTSGGNGFAPLATAYSGPAHATPTSPLNEVDCSTYLPLQIQATAGTTYYFMLGSYTPVPTFTIDVTTAVPFTAPVITAPSVKVKNDPGQCGATVVYDHLSVTGNPTPSTSVWPPSGSFFGVGVTDVSVSASNAVGYASTTFPVTVRDTERPHVTAPGTVTVDATGPAGAVVSYPDPTATDNCPGVTVATSPASGSQFPIGLTKVTATATDAAGNHATAFFYVHVEGAAAQLTELSNAVTGVGRADSLNVTVGMARIELALGHPASACVALRVFLLEVKLQTPRFIPSATAETLVADARRILTVLGCGP